MSKQLKNYELLASVSDFGQGQILPSRIVTPQSPGIERKIENSSCELPKPFPTWSLQAMPVVQAMLRHLGSVGCFLLIQP